MRYISAQFSALLSNDLWIDNARHANDMARRLHDTVRGHDAFDVGSEPEVNSLFPAFSPAVATDHLEALREWSFFYDWDPPQRQVRWMTAWDTTPDDISAFRVGIDHFLP